MADKVNVVKGEFLDPRVENEDGTFGAMRPGYRDPDTHTIVFDEDPVEVAAPVAAAPAEVETVEAESEMAPARDNELERLEGVGQDLAAKLNAAGIETVAQLRDADEGALKNIEGVGEATARKLKAAVEG